MTTKTKPYLYRYKKRKRKKKARNGGLKWIRCHGCNDLYTIDNPCGCVLDSSQEEE